jgi:hypothetical protein
MTFHRHPASRTTGRTVTTRMAQADGGDRGFLWALRSYWNYAQVGDDVPSAWFPNLSAAMCPLC